MKELVSKWNKISLVKRILVGLIIGIILSLLAPKAASPVIVLGSLFVGALKAVAPILVFFLVMTAISQHKSGKQTNMKSIIILYLLGTFLAGLTAVVASFMFPIKLTLGAGISDITPPGGVVEVLKNLLLNVVDNPVKALFNANYIGILSWAIIFGLALKNASESTKTMISNVADALSQAVRWIINLAPFGIMGLVFDSIATQGLSTLLGYGQLIVLLVGFLFVFFQ